MLMRAVGKSETCIRMALSVDPVGRLRFVMGHNPFWKRMPREVGTGRCLSLELVRQELCLMR